MDFRAVDRKQFVYFRETVDRVQGGRHRNLKDDRIMTRSSSSADLNASESFLLIQSSEGEGP